MPYKVILLGSSGVGKSNLLLRLNKNEFNPESTSTIGVEFLGYEVGIDGERVKAQIWDTAGQERFISMMGSYYRNSKGALIVYDITDKKSFEAVELWRKELEQRTMGSLTLLLVGNKKDLEAKREISQSTAEAYAKKHGMEYIETSALTGENIKTAFLDVIVRIHKINHIPSNVFDGSEDEDEEESISLNKNTTSNETCC